MTGEQLTFDATPEELILFMSEAEEQLEILNQDILRLEQEGDTNSELLQEIFRAAHTLKGSSGAIGHQRMARLTHALETVLDHVRHHRLAVSTNLIDLLLKGLDALKTLLDEVTSGIASDIEIDDLCTNLVALTKVEEKQPTNSIEPTVEPIPVVEVSTSNSDAVSDETVIWIIECMIHPTALLPSARAFQIIHALEAIGTVKKSIPDISSIESGQVTAGSIVTVQLAIAEPEDNIADQIRKTVEQFPEIEAQRIASIDVSEGTTTSLVDSSGKRVILHIGIDSECSFPAARALQVVRACKNMGEIIHSTPSVDAIEAGKYVEDVPFQIEIAIPSGMTVKKLRAAVESILEVQVTGATTVKKNGSGPPIKTKHVLKATDSLPAKKAPEYPPMVPVDLEEVQEVMQGYQSVEDEGQQISSGPLSKAAEPTKSNKVESPVPISQAKTSQNSTAGSSNTPINQQDRQNNAGSHAPRMVRIDVERLDALMNLVGELVIDRTRLARIATRLTHHTDEPTLVEELTETCRHLARISDDLQDEVMRSRMLPIESVFSKFPRLVRDLAQKVGKRIDFIVEGKDTELDRSVAEQISDPIIHLLRNSIDHGIESEEERRTSGKPEVGQVRLSARHEENQIVIDIEDDGRGMSSEKLKAKAVSKGLLTPESASRMSDREALELIFGSGFSTAEQVSDISGRGVGMDIVRTNVERLNGSITLETELGQGTRFTVRLPLTLAIIRALLIDVGGQIYAIPLSSVVEALRIERDELRPVNGREAIELRGQVLPLIRLGQIFNITSQKQTDADADRSFVVAVRWGERRGGLLVDSLIGEQEIVIKSLGKLFRNAHGISGGAVLGDGRVAPILDVAALIKHILSEQSMLNLKGATA
jgi:chemotaxis protein histidine kinase CheA